MINSSNGNLPIVETLIKLGVPVNSTNEQKQNALMMAAKNGKDFIICYLIEKLAYVNERDLNGNNALMYAVQKEHYEVSMKVGELVLFPAVRKAATTDIIAAAGTSCRHQIKDGTGLYAKHPVEVIFEGLL